MNARTFINQRRRIMQMPKDSKRNAAMRHLVQRSRASVIILAGKVTGWRLPCGTVVCAKVRFRDRERADAELARIASDNWNAHRVPIRAYPCEHCGGWHLTSQPRDSR